MCVRDRAVRERERKGAGAHREMGRQKDEWVVEST